MASENDAIALATTEFLRPVIPEDVELVLVRVAGHPPARKVTVIIAQPGGMSLDQVAGVTKMINGALDAVAETDEDPILDGYTLEVTTPGLSWPLTTKADFIRVGSHKVKVEVQDGAHYTGTVALALDDAVTISTDAGDVVVAYSQIRKAVQALPF